MRRPRSHRAAHSAADAGRGPCPVGLLLVAVSLGGVAPAAAATVRFGDVAITVPDGFTVEQAAAPPLVERPVSLAGDDDGALYASDSSGSNAKLAEQQADPRHRILRLVDDDGDGVFDRRTVFADRLMMLQGTLWHRGSLYAATGSQIVRLTDNDGDGVADDRVTWFDGKTLTGCGNDIHGPYLGRDGWFYWCKGAFAEQTHDLPGRPGWKTRAAHVFRARPDRPVAEIEPVLTGGMDNPVDVAFTAAGERFLAATFIEHPAGGRRDGLIHALYGGVYGKEHGVLDGHPRTGDLLPALVHMGPAAACGLHAHSGFRLGPDFADSLLACSFNLRTVSRHRLVPAGGSFTTIDEPFLTADAADFHPTDVIEDADGSVLVVDTGGWYRLCCPTSQLEKPAVLGAIYRVRRDAAPPVADPRGRKIPWAALDGSGLAPLLADERPAVVERAIDSLAQRGDTAVPPLARLLGVAPEARTRRAIVWAATRIDTPAARQLITTALGDVAAEVRHAASHAAGLLREPAAVEPLAAILSGSDGGPARAAAEALGRIGGPRAGGILLAASAGAADRATEHSLTHALIECGDTPALTEALRAAAPRTRRAALVALDQRSAAARPGPPATTPSTTAEIPPLAAHVIAACRDADPGLRDAGWWIAGRHPEMAAALAADVPAAVARAAESTEEQPLIVGRVARLAANQAISAALADICRSGDADAAGIAREVMRTARPGASPDAWIDALAAALAADGDAVADTLDTLARLAISPEQRQRIRGAALAVSAAADTPTKLRVLAARVAGPEAGLPEPVVDRLVALVGADPDDDDAGVSTLERSAAVAVLAAARPGPAALVALAPALARLPANDVSQLLPLYTKAATSPAGPVPSGAASDPLALALTAVAVHPDPASLSREAIAACVAALPEGGRDAGAALLARADAARAGVRESFERLAAALPPGDAARGHTVFMSGKAACTGCHAMAYVGGRIGPDLSKIGGIRTPRDLLEAIVLPSASFVRSYEPVTVITADGRAFQGVVRDDTAAEVVLQVSATAVERIPRGRIESITPGSVSLMPKGYDTILSPQELSDLVAFLARAK